MNPTPLEQEILEFARWRDTLTGALTRYYEWLESKSALDIGTSVKIHELIDKLANGRLLIAFVAEFSRGKSELINALFFADMKDRLLPSSVGRTTMCPTELFHDAKAEPYLMLLPIDTRRDADPISHWKSQPLSWTKVRLDLSRPDKVKEAFKMLTATRLVHHMDAHMMGLAGDPSTLPCGDDGEPLPVEIPAWRYAMINFPHPLLSGGVSILDTPGLNALGSEPELTMSTLPSAQAVVFLLGADTGVTKSDLEIWQTHVPASASLRVAVINKVDVIWDTLKPPEDIRNDLNKLVHGAAATLKIPPESVFPLSAKKALLDRLSGETGAKPSGIERLERFLAQTVLPSHKRLVVKAIAAEVGVMLGSSRAACVEQLKANERHLRELDAVLKAGKVEAASGWHELAVKRDRVNQVGIQLREFKVSLAQHRREMNDIMSAAVLDAVCDAARTELMQAWTTRGLTRGMRDVVGTLSGMLDQASELAARMLDAVVSHYEKFCDAHGVDAVKPPKLSLDNIRVKLQIVEFQTEAFCTNPKHVMLIEKRFLIERFWDTLIDQARSLFAEAMRTIEVWTASVQIPIDVHMTQQKRDLAQQIEVLTRMHGDSAAVQEAIKQQFNERNRMLAEVRVMDELVAQIQSSQSPTVPEARQSEVLAEAAE